MKRLRLERWSGHFLSPRTRPCCLRPQITYNEYWGNRRRQTSGAAMDITFEDEIENLPSESTTSNTWRSPPPEAALQSSKLAALHARLILPKKLPLQTMARTLVDPSADTNKSFNNASLSAVGGPIISYHVAEYLLCHYPRLPMTVLFAAAYAYNGPKTLTIIAKEWGVETAAFPGSEVDPGLLQFSKLDPGAPKSAGGRSIRPDKDNYRRGWSSRIVYDDEFGDLVPREDRKEQPQAEESAYSEFVKAVVGSIYLHAGRAAAKNFVEQHILSRHLEISSLFAFKEPVRELLRLCQREEFEAPVARILSETGRHSRSPVFVVGIYSGKEKLGEGSAPTLLEARIRASVAALKSWYLYSPGKDTRLPSEMEQRGAKEWEPAYVDIGEVIH